MKFDRNITEFPTMLHRDIYMTALRMTPPEVSLAEIDKTDPDLAKSGREFHAFMIDLLADMYDNARLYGMNPNAYEEFTNGRRYNAVKRERPTEARVFFDQSAAELSSYLELLKSIASLCMIEDGICVLSAENFEYIKSYKYLPSRQRENAVPIKTVIDMFERAGLAFHENTDGSTTVTSSKYPHMFAAMSALAKAVDDSIKKPKSSSLKYFYSYNWGYLEFRQIFENYAPVYEDYTRFLSDDGQGIMMTLHNMANEYKMNATYARPYMIEYTYKGKKTMTISVHDLWIEPHGKQKQWIRSMYVSIPGSPRFEYQQKVEKHGEDFVKYFRRHLNYCSCCTPDHVLGTGGIRQVLGRNVRICGPGPGGVIKNPATKDLPYIKKYIDLRIEEILAGVK
jgi:hypothetical protein